MSQEPRFGRMIPAMVTPFDENRELDVDHRSRLSPRASWTAAATRSS